MSDEFKPEDKKIKFLIYLATPYAFLCAILYLYSFWSSFSINFLEFITLADILKVAIYPIVGSLIAFLAGHLYSLYSDEVLKKRPKQRSKRETRFWRILLLIIAVYYIYLHFENFLFIGSVIIGLLLTDQFIKMPSVNKLMSNKNLLWSMVFFCISLPLICFSIGKSTSLNIINGYKVRYARVSQFKDKQILGNQSQIKYIGLGGKHYFFISEENGNLYIINSEKIGILELSKPSSEKYKSPWDDWFKKEPASKINNKK